MVKVVPSIGTMKSMMGSGNVEKGMEKEPTPLGMGVCTGSLASVLSPITNCF